MRINRSIISNQTESVPISRQLTIGGVTYDLSQDRTWSGGGGGVTGSGTTNYLSKWTSGTAIGSSVVYDNGTNVVIGTPGEYIDYKLEVMGAARINGGFYVNSGSTFASSLYGDGQLLSGAATQPILYLESTWNTTGNANGIMLNVTNTASGASSRLMNLRVDSVSKFVVSKEGAIKTAETGSFEQYWKLGPATTGTVTPDTYIQVEINGQIYSIPALLGTP